MSDTTRYSAVKPLDLSAIKQGSFIGTAGKPGANGSIQALEVVVFPEEARPYRRRALRLGSAAWQQHDQRDGCRRWCRAIADVTWNCLSRQEHQDHGAQGCAGRDHHPGHAAGSEAWPGGVRRGHAYGDDWNAARIVVEKDGVKPPM